VDITYDPATNERNIRERGLSFERAADFDFQTAIFWVDARRDYGEVRRLALGYLGDRLHVLCFTETAGGIRVISFRRANAREARRYEQAQAQARTQTADR
jgi:uncharacterized DUF497 family protein